jgi:Zn-dependent peptidase ImmA (M78 family)
MEDEDIHLIAEGFRSEYLESVDIVPVPIEEIVELKLGIEIRIIPELKTSTDIDGFLSRDLKEMYIDENIYNNPKMLKRLRFTYAHELGHFAIHKPMIEGIEIHSEEKWIDFRTGLSEYDLSRFEYQAYEFAGRLLVPREILIDQLEYNREKIELFKRQSSRYNKDELIQTVSRVICDHFLVSDQVIVKRIIREGLWDEMEF